MERSAVTDFERLFEKCSTDSTYRRQLSEAILHHHETQVIELLRQIGVQGTEEQAPRRAAALMEAYDPMAVLANKFEEHGFMAP